MNIISKKRHSTLSRIILHILFWMITLLFFVLFSIIRPRCITSIYMEFFCVFFIAIIVYFNFFFLYPRHFKKSQIKYWGFTFISIFISVLIEFFLFSSDFGIPFSEFIYNQWVLASFLFVFLRNTGLILFFLLLKHSQETKNSLEKEIQILQQKSHWQSERYEIEKRYIRSKIAPHFLYNTINYIIYCALERKGNISELLYKLSGILDYYMVGSNREEVLISQELTFYRNFIELENNRYEQSIHVDFEVIGDYSSIKITPLLYECFIGNAFKYTLHDGNGFIKIRFDFSTPNRIDFSCINNKQKEIGRHDMVSSKSGLEMTRQRLEMLYKNSYTLSVENHDALFEVTLQIKDLN